MNDIFSRLQEYVTDPEVLERCGENVGVLELCRHNLNVAIGCYTLALQQQDFSIADVVETITADVTDFIEDGCPLDDWFKCEEERKEEDEESNDMGGTLS